MNPWDWAGVIAAAAVIVLFAAVIAIRAQSRKHWTKLRDLLDLSRDDVDPDWERVRQTLGTPPDK